MKSRRDRDALGRLAVVAAAAVEAEELLRLVPDAPTEVRLEAERRIKRFHLAWEGSKR